MTHSNTIAAIATAPGQGGIGIIRVSGRALLSLVQQLTARDMPPRTAVFTPFLDADLRPIDEGIALFFPAPHSYTGEDVLELQGHGGTIVMRQLLERCLALGARLARPGEFTERAFLNGRMDLLQAEGVADLIEASTAQAARAALRSLTGDFSSLIQDLSEKTVSLRVLVEGVLDFPEEDVEWLAESHANARLTELRNALESALASTRLGTLLREGIQVVLIGAPNVGKSSLLNALAGRELAIVTDIPGTTRDAVRDQIEIDGMPVHVIDTAGIRETDDPVEKIGIARTWTHIEQADLALVLFDINQPQSPSTLRLLERLPKQLKRLSVLNKVDICVAPELSFQQPDVIRVSAKTGLGLSALKAAIAQKVGWHLAGEGLFTARARHIKALELAAVHVANASEVTHQLELYAEDLRLAHEALGSITGAMTSDDLLGEIFSRFCIGK